MTQHLLPGICCLILDVPQYLTIMGKEDTGSESFGLNPEAELSPSVGLTPDSRIDSRLTPSGCPTILPPRRSCAWSENGPAGSRLGAPEAGPGRDCSRERKARFGTAGARGLEWRPFFPVRTGFGPWWHTSRNPIPTLPCANRFWDMGAGRSNGPFRAPRPMGPLHEAIRDRSRAAGAWSGTFRSFTIWRNHYVR